MDIVAMANDMIFDYIEVLDWSMGDLLDEYGIAEDYYTDQVIRQALIADLCEFIRQVEGSGLLDEYLDHFQDIDEAKTQMAHDFCLTRDGHGAGFWGRGYGELGEKLSEIASNMGANDSALIN